MAQGWVCVHRQLLDNPIFKNDKIFRVFMFCLLRAQHTAGDQLVGDSVVYLDAGQLATGRISISDKTGLSQQSVRTAISKLEKLGILTIKPTTKYSVITMTNWDKYQQTNQQATNKQPTSNQQVTTSNNDNNDKNEKNVKFSKPSLQELIDYFGQYATEKSFFINRDEPEKFYDFYESKNWMVGKTKMKSWKAAVRNWLRGNSSKPQQSQQQARAPRAFGE